MNLTLSQFQACLIAFEKEADSQTASQHDAMMAAALVRMNAPRLNQYYSEILRQHGLTQTLWYALMMLFASPSGSLSPSELSQRLDLTRTSATRLADELERRGWAQRQPHESDRRSIILAITGDGQSLIRTLSPALAQARAQLWQDFTPEETTLLASLLERLLGRLDKLREAPPSDAQLLSGSLKAPLFTD